MASLTIAASFAGSTTTVVGRPSTARKLVAVKAAKVENKEVAKPMRLEKGQCNGRREAMFAAATFAISAVTCSIPALAEEEPKNGTPEAKKKYAQICVTMPTARVCRK